MTALVVTLGLETVVGAGVGVVFITCVWRTGDKGGVPGSCVGEVETGDEVVTVEVIERYVVCVGMGVPVT